MLAAILPGPRPLLLASFIAGGNALSMVVFGATIKERRLPSRGTLGRGRGGGRGNPVRYDANERELDEERPRYEAGPQSNAGGKGLTPHRLSGT
jgi:hypothetical protein